MTGLWDELRVLSETDFEEAAQRLFRDQLTKNPLYRSYVDAVSQPTRAGIIPFLPIHFFKEQLVMTGHFEPQVIFESSGTTGTIPSRHAVFDLAIYRDQLVRNFERFYGPVGDWCILALLPSYLERGNSSLVYMVNHLIESGAHPDSGFYLSEWAALIDQIQKGESLSRKTLLIGVGFALLDLAERFQGHLRFTTILETGGMKGRRKEWIREELHAHLSTAFGVSHIHSEYGMTELISQAYSTGNGLFTCPPWMRVLVREEEDPFTVKSTGRGLINVIDLANIHSCAFIATDDVGEVFADGRFAVQGRRDGSDLRGCSLLLQRT